MANYWGIKWNAKAERSSRMFQTFLDKPELFETYGYKSIGDIRRFAKVKKRDQVFCYQKDEGAYVAKCEVKDIESNAPGGLCLVLVRVCRLRPGKDAERKGTIHKLNDNEVKALCERCEPPWPPIPP